MCVIKWLPDREEPKEGVEDKTPGEPKHNQPVRQVYSRRKKWGTCGERREDQLKIRKQIQLCKKGEGCCVRQVGSGRERGRDPGLCSITDVLILFACSTFHCYLLFSFHWSRDVG